jgi:predicted nucleic acid-binding protein
MSGVTLDTGALIALERGSRRMIALLKVAEAEGATIAIPAAVVAQAWRGGARQARIARLLDAAPTTVVPLDDLGARFVGVICGQVGVSDVVDVSVVVCARERGHAVVTSDPEDLQAIDPKLELLQPN